MYQPSDMFDEWGKRMTNAISKHSKLTDSSIQGQRLEFFVRDLFRIVK